MPKGIYPRKKNVSDINKRSLAKIGSKNGMFGKKMSPTHKEKLFKALRDRRGAKNPNWKGTTPLNKAIRELPESRNLKVEIFIRDNRTCQVPGCLSRTKIQAHHIKSISEIIYINQLKTIEDALSCKLIFDPENLITLCDVCHKKTKNYGSSSYKYFVDHRGSIKDLYQGKLEAITEVTFEKGAIRGNHKHPLSKQVDFVADGLLLVSTGDRESIIGPGEVIEHLPGVPHAYKAIKKSRLISFFDGPRKGKDYEKDLVRLKEHLL